MRIAEITVQGVEATASEKSKITAGMVGATVQIRYPDPYWAGLVKNVTFKGADEVTLLNVGDTVTIPPQTVAKANVRLQVGIVGISADGITHVTPTLWADLGVVKAAAPTDPKNSGDMPTVNVPFWSQLESMIGNLADLTTEEKSNLVAAINEVNEKAGNMPELQKLVAQINALTEENKQQADAITRHEKDIADLKYFPIDITQITDNIVTMELGSVVREVTVSWVLNKEPVSQTLEGEAVDASLRSKTITGLELRENKSFTLVVTDEREATDSAGTAVTFLNGIYYGALAAGAVPDSGAVLEMTRKLQSGRGVTFTYNPAAGKRPSYACPSRYGTPKFTIGGFEYEWVKLGTIDFTNASGYTESYDVWQHPQDVSTSLSITAS